jgi:glycogen operon protein
LAFLLAGGSEQDRDLYVMINAHPAERRFLIQGDPRTWKRVVDTSLASPQDITKVGEEALLSNSSYVVGARSVVVLLA